MSVYSSAIRFIPERKKILLREMTGYDEIMTDDAGSSGILQLLKQLVIQDGENNQELKMEKIALADRDRILCSIYRNTYGSRIDSSLTCQRCRSPFDLSFSLDDLLSHQADTSLEMDKDEWGYYQGPGDLRFRLPDGEDELAVIELPTDEAETVMVKRCITGAGSREKIDQIQEIMENLAPMILNDMLAICPECGEQQLVHFDMQNFLQAKMKTERRLIAAEVHCLAYAYHWSHDEIMQLPRSLRKLYVGFAGLE